MINGGVIYMNRGFAKVLQELRKEKGYSQQQLANKLFVDRTSVANWETGRRMPDALTITQISKCFGVDTDLLMGMAAAKDEEIHVLAMDDEYLVLEGTTFMLREVLPKAHITGFTKEEEAIEFAKANHISIAFLDIDMGMTSGLDICNKLLEISPTTNVIFLTAHDRFALEAWETKASGFLLKPLTKDDVLNQLTKLRHPIGEHAFEQLEETV